MSGHTIQKDSLQTPANIYDENVSERVRLFINVYLKKQSMSATSLAEKIGMTKYQLSKIRNAKANATVKVLRICTDELEANANWLLSGEGEMFFEKEEKF